MPEPIEQWQLDALVDRILDHFGYAWRFDKTCDLEIRSSHLATLTLNAPLGQPLLAFELCYVTDDDLRLNKRKRQNNPDLEKSGWMIREMKQMFPDSLIEIREATKV